MTAAAAAEDAAAAVAADAASDILGRAALEQGYILVMLCVCCWADWLSDSPDVSPSDGCGASRLSDKLSGRLLRLPGGALLGIYIR